MGVEKPGLIQLALRFPFANGVRVYINVKKRFQEGKVEEEG